MMKTKWENNRDGKKHISHTKKIIRSEETNDRLEELSGRVNSFYDELRSRYTALCKEESKIDLEITDINHYIEFGKLDAYRGYNAYVMLHDRLVKRRKIKTEKSYLQSLIDVHLDQKSKRYLKKLGDLDYEPRIIKELFK
jgi:hypothetical protein